MPTMKHAFFALLITLACALPTTIYAKGVVNISCSSQIAEAFGTDVVDQFQATTGLDVNLHVFSSQVALNRLKNGVCDLASTALKLSPEDKKSGLVVIPFAKDPMVVIAGDEIPVSNLSLAEVRRLFSGFISNWQEVGGPDLPVRIVTPIKETGAYVNFVRQAMGASNMKFDYQAARSSAAVEAVNHIPGSISFATRSVINKYPDIHIFTIDGMDPSDEAYPFTQTFSFVTRGQPSGVVREVLNYAMTEKARNNMKNRGLTPLLN